MAFLALAALSALLFAHDTLRHPVVWAPGLAWQAEGLWRQPWRLLTAAFVHHDLQHLAFNLCGCAAVAWFGMAARLGTRETVAALLAWPATHALLWWTPGLAGYGGLSGVLHAAVAVAAVALARRDSLRQRLVGVAVWTGLALKVVLEAPWAGAVQSVPGWDMPVAVAGHAAGLVCGTAAMIGMGGLAARVRP